MSTATPIVFIVDDDISVRESLELLVRCEGWQPETFESAQAFLERPRSFVPSCLVLDVSLPGLNGLDLQKRIAAERTERWHRAGFQLYWRIISRACKPVGRKPVSREIRELIFKMVADNPTGRAPRIHGELAMLGFEVSERSVSRWMRRAPRAPDPSQRWLTFLRNHREAIAAMDLFSVPTITFGVLYCFFVIGHDRRRILHFNVTPHPTSSWIS